MWRRTHQLGAVPALCLRHQPCVEGGHPLGQVPAEPGVPHDVLQGQALRGVAHQNSPQQVTALAAQLQLLGDAEVQVQGPLHPRIAVQGQASGAGQGLQIVQLRRQIFPMQWLCRVQMVLPMECCSRT